MELPTMWIHRDFSEILTKASNSFPAVALLGARQTGKTSLVKHLFPNYNYVSLDIPSVAEMADSSPKLFLEEHPAPLIIDEVQYAPKLFRYLKAYIDEHRSDFGSFVLTGSQKFELMQNISESLAGRCAILNLDTLTYNEVRKVEPNISFLDFVLKGGYPELYQNGELSLQLFFQSYIATYLERDVRSLLRVLSLRDFSRFMRAVALRSGQLLNKTELARDVGISPSTSNEWLSILVASNLITLLEPYFSNGTKSLIKSPKIYFNDTGLLCALLNINTLDVLRSSPLLGNIWENFVFCELKKKQCVGQMNLFFWRDRYGLEVDFLIPEGGCFSLIEAKLSEHPELGQLKNLLKLATIIGKENIKSLTVASNTAAPYKLYDDDLEISVTIPNLIVP